MQVGHIEDFPAELQTVSLPRHFPALVQRHVQASIAISTNYVSGAGLPGIRMHKVSEGRGRIGEDADCPGDRIPMMPNLRPGGHPSDPLLGPIGWPEVAVIHGEREAAGPAR